MAILDSALGVSDRALGWAALAVLAALSLLVRTIWIAKPAASPQKQPLHFKAAATTATASSKASSSQTSNDDGEFACMGEIEPLVDLDWKTERPERIYKFADKYNLTMGLRKTSINTITRIDQQYVERIEERKRILAKYPGALGCLPAGKDMVDEFYRFMATKYLPQRYPTIFTLDKTAGTLRNCVLGDVLPLAPPDDKIEALRLMALSVDEDFLMLLPSPDGEGYSLQSFVWLYPVGFDPVDKLGLKLSEAHGPVPGYKKHLQLSMDRYFKRLQPGHVVDRVNWAVATNAALCERGEYHLYSDDQVTTTAHVDLSDTWVRCELQTLFALPATDARILSVHLYLYPIHEIKDVGLSEAMTRAIDGYGAGNVPEFARYKRIPVWGKIVKEYLAGKQGPDEKTAEAEGEK